MKKARRKIAIIYEDFQATAIYQEHEREAGESIVVDAKRIRDILSRGGDEVCLISVRRSIAHFARRLISPKPDLVFNLCEGAMGCSQHEMNICALLDIIGIPYTGSGPLTLGMALDKALAKKILTAEGIVTPRYFVCDGRFTSIPKDMSYPLFVKPSREDASLGIDRHSLAADARALRERCRFIARHYRQPALVEEYIEGRELNVSILGTRVPIALPISEIDMSSLPAGNPRVCDYRAKWIPESDEYAATVPVCPARLDSGLEKKIKGMALAVFRALQCRGYARVDFRLSMDGVPYVLEANPNPCLSPDAGFARSAAAGGFPYPRLIRAIADLACGVNP